mgnify:CR=1 FL=1
MSSLVKYIKHPKIFHFDWSENLQNDDRMLANISGFENEEVVATVKLDGENTTCYHNDHVHARSIDSLDHESRSFAKRLLKNIAHEIPNGWRICGENMYAKHSIYYENLDSYFYIHSIWNEKNNCICWDDMVEWCKLLDIPHVPLLYRGKFEENGIKSLFSNIYNGDAMEGYVVRIAKEFTYSEYKKCVGKFVRKNHVQSSEHWLRQEIIQNKVKGL